MKKYYAILIALVLAVMACVFTVSAETETSTYCPRCRKDIPADEWAEWTVTGGDFLKEGHYYLAENFTAQEDTVNIPALKFVCLDLRGNTWITEGIRTLEIYGDLSILDSVGGGTILTTGANGKSGGFAYIGTSGALNLFGGTIQFVPRDDIKITSGGLVCVEKGTVNVDGATVTGGIVKGDSSTNAFGGNFYVYNGAQLIIESGTVSKGMVLSALNEQGGNIYATGDSTVTINGGVVEDGYTDSAGGNIFIGNASMTMTGGTVRNGNALSRGGNIIFNPSNQTAYTIRISGGTITGGVVGGGLMTYADKTDDSTLNPTCGRGTYGGGNLYVRAPYSNLIIEGGVIDGDFMADQYASFTLSGAPKINLGKSTGLQFKKTVSGTDGLEAKDTVHKALDVSGLTEGAEIYVQANGTFSAALTEATATQIAAYFKPAMRTVLSVTDKYELKGATGGSGTQGYCPHCKELVTWKAGTNATNDGDHIYLSGSNYSSSSNLIIQKDLVLDLNGYTLNRDTKRVIVGYQCSTVKTLSVLDSFGGGKMEGTSIANADGGLLYIYSTGALELYSGTLRVTTSVKNPSTANTVMYGGVIYASGNVTIHGGRITGGVVNVAANDKAYGGGNIAMLGGTLTVKGGIISNGKQSGTTIGLRGGNIFAITNVKIEGGLIMGGSAAYGGNIYSKTNTLTISGGTIYGGTATDNTETSDYEGKGGNVLAYKMSMTGGALVNGSSDYMAGNLYFPSESTTRTVSGGTIISGTSPRGGNIYLYGGSSTASSRKGTLTLSGTAKVFGGKATSIGGNISVCSATLNLQTGACVAGGSAPDGGNIYLSGRDALNVTGQLLAGTVTNRGGNLYMAATTATVAVKPGAYIANGKAKNGGNIYGNNGKLTITGGKILNGTATENAGNIFLNYYINTEIKDDGDATTPAALISGGKAKGGKGGNIYVNLSGNTAAEPTYYVKLGNCTVENGEASGNGDNIYVNKNVTFEVLEEFDGYASIFFHSDLVQNGTVLDKNFVFCNGVYTGLLLFENNGSMAEIMTTNMDITLVIAKAALKMKDGTLQWYADNATALAAYNENTAYIQPEEAEFVLPSGTFVVDLAGKNLMITGVETALVYCFDSANLDYESYGIATIDGPVLQNVQSFSADGIPYITIQETENTYSFHCLNMRVSGVSIRPSSAGLYYRCTWNCDDTVKTMIKNFGVAVSVKDMPKTNFTTDGDTLYTQKAGANLTIGTEYNSVLVNNIFNTAATDNSTRGQTPIYVTPYVELNGGDYIVCADDFSRSMQSVLRMVDNNNKLYYANKIALENFYTNWETVMDAWDFANIGVKPQDDNVLRILMGGNSFAYYYVEELYGLLMENLPEGVDEVEIYNFYYSGRGMGTHYDRWINNKPGDYDLFFTSKAGRVKLQPNGGWTLEDVLAVANWDYVGLQGTPNNGTSYANADELDLMCEGLAVCAEALFGRIHEMFPHAQLLWHRTWAQEVGRITDTGFTYTEEYNERYDPGMQYVCDWMTEVFDQDKPYDLIQVNSGASWKVARELNAALIAEGGEEAGLLPYGGLCAMLARNTFGDKRPGSGDGQHDGDIGGGQLINAYSWYMVITGDSDLTDNMYKPDYEMSDALWNMLKQAVMTTYAADHPAE